MALTRGKTTKEILAEQIAEFVGAGRFASVEAVDFSDPHRPKTALEADFPILPINQVAAIEGNSGKPIYQMSKWWARRRSSVFRSILIAAAIKAPDDPSEAAKAVWDAYYANHQSAGALKHLKVADIFMGGGTTVVEGARLGMQMFGNDLNPVAWLTVKNEMAKVDPTEIQQLLNHIEAEVKPQIKPFYACDCPRGHKGRWTRVSTGEVMDTHFDPLTLAFEERQDFRYEGPEIIYTFWAKHGPCQVTDCGHRTPIMTSPVVAVKTLTVKAWMNRSCSACGQHFDVEQHDVRMAPGSALAVAPDERPFAIIDGDGNYSCPNCEVTYHDSAASNKGSSINLGKPVNKKVELTLLVHPQWLKGSPKNAPDGSEYGGSVTDSPEATIAWDIERASKLRLLEVRGKLPLEVTCPETGVTFRTDKEGGTVPKRSTFTCQECGRDQDVRGAIKESGKTGPVASYVVQGYCPACDAEKKPYGGRFFAAAKRTRGSQAAHREWDTRKDTDLAAYWPKSEVPTGFMTDMLNGSIRRGHKFTHWWKMFNSRQLLVLSQLLKAITHSGSFEWEQREYVLGVFQQYLRNQNMFCFWDISRDCLVPHMSNNNYHSKSNVVENNVFSNLGRGNWTSCTEVALEGADWAQNPWEAVANESLTSAASNLVTQPTGKSSKVFPGDQILNNQHIDCTSSTDLSKMADNAFDLVITDPPFGGLLHYSELSDFFYVWLRLVLRHKYPEIFSAEYTPKALEAVANKARHPDDPAAFYQRLLTECWREAKRILKPGGLLAFTFHHSEDEPWVAVLESLFEAGFYLEVTYPIRSDETKGDTGQFGARQIEYDIIHVCRKRVEQPTPVSWARMRRQVMRDVRQLQTLLENHRDAGLPEADLKVIKRGKALEYFSKHYGQVYVEEGREFTVREALVGINQLLDDESDTQSEAPPFEAEPFTRQFLRLFDKQTEIPRDQMQKFLRGTGVAPSDFEARGWCTEKNKIVTMTSPLDTAREWKGKPRGGMAWDFDQTMFLIGACYEGSGIRVDDTLNSPHFRPHPALGSLLEWMRKHGGSFEIRNAADLAKSLYSRWEARNQSKVHEQAVLFDLTDAEV